jgi:hypothetical protein
MILNLLIAFLVGLIGANGVPHFVKGITGQPHNVPWQKPARPHINVIWGMINFAIAYSLSFFVRFDRPAGYLLLLGMFVTGFALGRHWEK